MSAGETPTLPLKLISLTVALTVFAMVAADRQTERQYTFELALADAPDGYKLMNRLPTVEATIRGPSREFARLNPSDTQVIRISVPSAQQDIYRIRASNFSLPSGLQVTEISPREVPLEFQQLQPVEVNVRPVTRGEPASGFVVGEVRVVPETVTIQTPGGEWDGTSIPTEPVEITGSSADIARTTKLKILDFSIDFDESTEVTVFVEVLEERESRRIDDFPIEAIGPASENTQISHETASVVLEGSREALEQIVPEDLLVTVDTSEVQQSGPGRYTLKPKVENLPDGVDVRSVNPGTVVVTIELPRDTTPPSPAADSDEEESDGVESADGNTGTTTPGNTP